MIALNDTNFDQVVTGKGTFVIDFMADWCQPCKPVGEILAQMEDMYPKVVFAKVNVDHALNIAGRYNIGSIPTILFITGGEPATVLVGSRATIYHIQKVLKTL